MQDYDSESVNQALRALAQGDRSSAERVFLGLWPVVSAFCKRALGEGSQDAAQEALMKVFEQAHRFRQDGQALAWALEIAAWECRTELARRRRLQLRTARLPADDTEPCDGPEATIERAQLAQAFRETVAQLAAKDRALVGSLLNETFPVHAGPADRKRKERALSRLGQLWRTLYGTP